jgi:putative peptide zinc metalloprotease protein
MRPTSRGLVLAAPEGRAYCEVAPHVRAWLDALDGSHNLHDLTDRFGADVAPLARDLWADGYLTDSPPPTSRRVTVTRQGVEVAGADRLVRALYPVVRPLVSPVGVGVLATLGLVGMLAPLIGWLDLETRFVGSPLTTALALLVTGLIVGVVHEFGHAVVLAHFGGAIGRVGAGLYWGAPSVYVDASAALMLPRRARMWQAAAGIFIEAALAGVLVLSAQALPDGTAHTLVLQAAALAVIGVLVNAAPLLQLDGYWLVADALDVPDVYRHAWDALRRRRESRRRQALLAVYVILGGLFGVVLLVAAAAVWTDLLSGIIAALWSAGWIERAIALLLLLPLVGIVIQPLASAIHLLHRHNRTGAPS